MFVYTAKMDKKKLLVAVLLTIAVVAAVLVAVVIKGASAVETLSLSAVVKTNEQRVEYLTKLGWKVTPEPLEEQTIIIPEELSGVYEEYNALQKAQGFDLSKYGGAEAKRFTYAITNYPGAEEQVVADMIIYRGRVIAGDIQSVALDGFMQTLEFPKKRTT